MVLVVSKVSWWEVKCQGSSCKGQMGRSMKQNNWQDRWKVLQGLFEDTMGLDPAGKVHAGGNGHHSEEQVRTGIQENWVVHRQRSLRGSRQ